MAFSFDDDIDWIFTFCRNCWDFRKFTFSQPIDFNTEDVQIGTCVTCKKEQNIDLKEAKDYYEHLNDHNN